MGDGDLTSNEVGPFIFQRKDNIFSPLIKIVVLSYNAQMWFSGERCGPFASCFGIQLCLLRKVLKMIMNGSNRFMGSSS